jgi:hypothetical protein
VLALLSFIWGSIAMLCEPFWGSVVFFRKSGEDPLYLLSQFDSNMRSRMDLRENIQLMEKYPQPIPRISKVFWPLKYYIKRPPHGEKGRY